MNMQMTMMIDKHGLHPATTENEQVFEALNAIKLVGFRNCHLLAEALAEANEELASGLNKELDAQLYFKDILRKEKDHDWERSLQSDI
jgi:hypothetical protein